MHIFKAAFLATTSYFIAQGWLEATYLRRIWRYIFNINPTVIDDSEKILQDRAEARAQMEESRRRIENEERRSYSVANTVTGGGGGGGGVNHRGSLSGPMVSVQTAARQQHTSSMEEQQHRQQATKFNIT